MKQFNAKKATLGVVLVLTGLVGCTKETPYKYQLKDEVLSKSVVDTSAEYLYASSYATASRSSDDAIPFFMGAEELVKFRFTKDALEVVSQDDDERFRGNGTNNKVIMTIPVQHKQYRCSEDRFGECQNQEEENNDVTDLQKDSFKPDFASLKEVAPSPLPADMTQYFNGCYAEKSANVIGAELTDEAMNIQIEKTYTIAPKCLNRLESLKDAVVSIVYHHSFVKLNKIASPNYKPVLYPEADQNVFGYFTTQKNRLDQDYRDVQKGETTYMNRWNPNRSEVVYYLSDEFNKPENAGIKKASYSAFEKLNRALEAAGAKFRLTLKDPAHKFPGDIRNSMIVLVEDPSGAGLLGYGPAVTNPNTGEILSARTVMYSGIMKSGLRMTYEEIRDKRAAEARASQAKTEEKKEAPAEEKKTENAGFAPALKRALHQTLGQTLGQTLAGKNGLEGLNLKGAAFAKPQQSQQSYTVLSPLKVKEIEKSLKDYTAHADLSLTALADQTNMTGGADASLDQEIRLQAKRLAVMSKYCTYPMEYFNFEESMKGVEDVVGSDLKPWDQLSDNEKNKFIDQMLPIIYEQVLIHEMGHNLGLRHNFQGSEDKENWYKKGEIPGLNRTIPYSSVMDYGYSQTNELPMMGKYDVAALRYAYTGKVEVQKVDGLGGPVIGPNGLPEREMVTVNSTISDLKQALVQKQEDLRPYGYCTDEHVDANAGCNRFDEGTTLSEIAQHWIKSYNEFYKLRNFRNGLRSFSLMSDAAYLGARYSNFMYLRLMYETYERVKVGNNLSDNAEEWTKYPFLKDLKEAALMSGRFFLDVMKTPDVMCLLEDARDPNNVQNVVYPIGGIDKDALSCFDIRYAPGVTLLGQTGKFFQSKKDPNNPNPYVDQIDVRGIWPDKLVAANLLLKRSLGSPTFDKAITTYIDMPELRGEIAGTIGQLLMDRVTSDVKVVDAQGNESVRKLTYGLFDTHIINQPINPAVNRMIGLPRGEVPYLDQLMRMVKDLVPNSVFHESSSAFMKAFTVYRMSPVEAVPAGLAERGASMVEIDGQRYIALPENEVAQVAMVYYQTGVLLGNVNADGQGIILDLIKQGAKELPADLKVPDNLRAQLTAALQLPQQAVEALVAGQIREPEYYARLLSILPSISVR